MESSQKQEVKFLEKKYMCNCSHQEIDYEWYIEKSMTKISH